MWFCPLLLLWLGILTHITFGTVRPSDHTLISYHETNTNYKQTTKPLHLQKRATPCDELIDIIDDYGTLKGTLGGAQIVMTLSGEAGTTIGQFMTLLNTATVNVWALFDAAGCKRYQAPSGEEAVEEVRWVIWSLLVRFTAKADDKNSDRYPRTFALI